MQVLGDGRTVVENLYSAGDRLLLETVTGHFQFGVGEKTFIVRNLNDVKGFGGAVQEKVEAWLNRGGYAEAVKEFEETTMVHQARKAVPTSGLLEQKAMKAGGNSLLAQINKLLDDALAKDGKRVDDAELAGFNPDEHPRTDPKEEVILPTIGEDLEYSPEIQHELETLEHAEPWGEVPVPPPSAVDRKATTGVAVAGQESSPEQPPVPSPAQAMPDQQAINNVFLQTLTAMQKQLDGIQDELATRKPGLKKGSGKAPKPKTKFVE